MLDKLNLTNKTEAQMYTLFFLGRGVLRIVLHLKKLGLSNPHSNR